MPFLSRSVLPTFSTDHDCYPGASPRTAPAVLRWCARLLATAVLLCVGVGLFGGASALAATAAHPVPASPKATHAAETAHVRLVASSTQLRPVRLTAPAAGSAPVTVSVTVPASGSVWDQVARCESGGRWNISTGNGYSGGLQFTPSTWRAYGGTQYASSANHATREQQIAIAEKVLAGQGPGAWPVCSKKAGLTRGHTGHTRQLGTSEQGCHTSQHGHLEQCNYIEPAEHHTGHHSESHRSQHSTHRRSNGDGGAHDGGAASSGTIVVKPGDTLSSLATSHHVSGGWQQLYHANRAQLDGNPNAIHAGQRLTLP